MNEKPLRESAAHIEFVGIRFSIETLFEITSSNRLYDIFLFLAFEQEKCSSLNNSIYRRNFHGSS